MQGREFGEDGNDEQGAGSWGFAQQLQQQNSALELNNARLSIQVVCVFDFVCVCVSMHV
jgi:hypothetical protein